MVAPEERLAVHAGGVRHQPLEEELVDEAGGAVAHRRRHLEERAEVVVDDHLAREAELLGVGLELVLRGLLGERAVLDLAVRADGLEVADVGEAEALVLLEVGEVAGGAELRGDDGLRLVGLHELLVGDVREDAGERHRGERGLDGGVVEGAGRLHALEPHALGEDASERHVRVFLRGLDRFLAHCLGERVAVDPRAERKRGLEPFRGHGVLLLDRDVHVGRGLLGAEGGKHGLVDLFLVPALGDGLRLDLRELAVADGLDHADAVALSLDCGLGDGLDVDRRGLRGLRGFRLHRLGGLDVLGGLRRYGGGGSCGGLRRLDFLFRFHYGVAFQLE